ncbi:MAG TPA: cyclase family protein [Cryomorphaceae bacterium]|nr:cyclase family protein [Cryomorphaceae bacterium]
MKIKIQLNDQEYHVDLAQPLDISIPLGPEGPRAWYVDPLQIEPVRNDHFIGSIAEGGNVNFRNIFFNPHGHGTHTESSGHIDKEVISVNSVLKQFFFTAFLVSIDPEIFKNTDVVFHKPGDRIITKNQIEQAIKDVHCEALLIRTIPNSTQKKTRVYSGTNPPYVEPDGLAFMRSKGVKHLLLDLPSVDREVDGGRLQAHHAFWHSGFKEDQNCTITEMIYVPDEIKDGHYLLNLQTAPFENDATPSRPVLFQLNR